MERLVYSLLIILLFASGTAAQNIYSTHNGVVTFFSEAPVANVDARNEKVKVELNASTNDLKFDASMADFNFKNDKMGRDADKKYLERDKYPSASFAGKVTTKIDYKKLGKHAVTVTGILKIHGASKKISEKGTIVVKENHVTVQAQFNALLKDYNIDTPKIMGKEMTAEKVLIKVDAVLLDQTGMAKKK
jgi:polyisoprenoid-binding protein YceI